jgi:DNA polymerase
MSAAAIELSEIIELNSDNPDFELHAHNAFFEQCIYENILVPRFGWPKVNPKRWRCTAAKAASHALPRSLEGAGAALGLPIQKDKVGHQLMLKMCKPLPKWKRTGKGPKYHETPEDLERLYDYCIIDVEAEYAVDKSLPDLSPSEQELWFVDQKINKRGVCVDIPNVKRVLEMIDTETASLKQRTQDLTMGLLESPSKRAQFLEYLLAEGLALPNAQARTIQEILDKGNLTPTAKELLEIKQSLSKTSTAKFKAFLARALRDGRARDLVLFNGASTGRWSGRGLQIQNFPRGIFENAIDVLMAIFLIESCDLEELKDFYGEVFSVFSSILRGMIVASPGKEMFVADYSSIELVTEFWLAGHEQGLTDFNNRIDLYKKQASVIYKIPYDLVEKFQRQMGKQAVLGCGYGMGFKKFLATCEAYGIKADLNIAKLAVGAYRELHWPIPKLWGNLEKAAMLAVINPKRMVQVNKTKWFKSGRFLYCELPSGRRLAYCDPFVKDVLMPWGQEKPCLHFYGQNPKTRQWAIERTWGGVLAENVTQATSRDLLADAIMQADAKDFDVTFHVHDELVAEADIGRFTLTNFTNCLENKPKWAQGLPIRTEAFIDQRYRK